MPLPMVHLAVAIQLMESLPVRQARSEFLLGSLAPDAIHMRTNTDRTDKQMTHLRCPENSRDLVPTKTLFTSKQNLSAALAAFTHGYVAHLLTDRLWIARVIPIMEERMAPQMHDEDQEIVYYAEADQIDVNLYAHAKWRPAVWRQLAQAQVPDFSPYLNADEISRWRDRNLHWFDETKAEPEINPVYLTEALVDSFIDQAAASVHEYLTAWSRETQTKS